MKQLQKPTCKQSCEADSICKVPLLDGILIEDFRHDFIVVDHKVAKEDDVAKELDANQQEPKCREEEESNLFPRSTRCIRCIHEGLRKKCPKF
jgi:hypothetical protein